MFNQSRRTFIKGIAYSSALTVGGLSSLAVAADTLATKVPTVGTEVVTLINHTASDVTFNSTSGSIAAGEQQSFIVTALSSNDNNSANNKNLFITDVLDDQLAINSDHPEFNGIIPITVFEKLAA